MLIIGSGLDGASERPAAVSTAAEAVSAAATSSNQPALALHSSHAGTHDGLLPSTPATTDHGEASLAATETRRARARAIIEAQRRTIERPSLSFEQAAALEQRPGELAADHHQRLDQQREQELIDVARARALLRREQQAQTRQRKLQRIEQFRLDQERQGDLFTKRQEPLADVIDTSSPQSESAAPVLPGQLVLPELSRQEKAQLGFWGPRHLERTVGLSSHDRQLSIVDGDTGSIYVEHDADFLSGWKIHPREHRDAQSSGEWTRGGLNAFLRAERRLRRELDQLPAGLATKKLLVAHDYVQGACSKIRVGFYDRNSADLHHTSNDGGRLLGLVRGYSYSASGARRALEALAVQSDEQPWAREWLSRKLKRGEKFVTDGGQVFRSWKKEIELSIRGTLRLTREAYEEELRCPLVQRLIKRLESYGRRKNQLGGYVRRIKKLGNRARLKSRRAQEALIAWLPKHYQPKPADWFKACIAWSHKERDRARRGVRCIVCNGTGWFVKHERSKRWTVETRPPAADVKCKTCKGTGRWVPVLPAKRLLQIEYALYEALSPKRRRFFDRLRQLFLKTRQTKSSADLPDSIASSDLILSEEMGEQAAPPAGRSPRARLRGARRASPPRARTLENQRSAESAGPRDGRREPVGSSSSAERSPPEPDRAGHSVEDAIEGRGSDSTANTSRKAARRSQEATSASDARAARSEEQALSEALRAIDSDPELVERVRALISQDAPGVAEVLLRRIAHLKNTDGAAVESTSAQDDRGEPQ